MNQMIVRRTTMTNRKSRSNLKARISTQTRCHRKSKHFVLSICFSFARFPQFVVVACIKNNNKRKTRFIMSIRISSRFSDDLEDFDGYQYPKPAIPFPLPSTTTSNPDAETVPTDSARLRKG